ncbi:MAG: acyltransferase [Candidatus Eisenbacteria bacterium]|nr:acyltransferase [Candidatus Eisenbacteria bacterium]
MDCRRNTALNRSPVAASDGEPGAGSSDIHGHLPALDGLRGVAILLVLFHHFNILHPAGTVERAVINFLDLGKHGVDLFFVLSGFLITGILIDTRGRPGYLTSFFGRRVLRIVPLYYLVLTFLLVAWPAILASDPGNIGQAMRWSAEGADAAWYYLFASNILFSIREGFGLQGLDVTWSLAIEEQFYLLWAVLVGLLRGRALLVASATVVLASPIIRAAIGFSNGSWLDAYLLTPGRLDALALGGLLAGLYRAPDLVPRHRLRKAAAWLAAGSASGLVLMQLGQWLNGFTAPGVILGLTFVGGLAAGGLAICIEAPASSRLARIVTSRPLRFFGRYSYGMYLLHMPIRNALRKFLDPVSRYLDLSGPALFGNQLLFLAIAIGAVSLAAWLLWHAWERPFLSLKRFVPRPQPAGVSNNPS